MLESSESVVKSESAPPGGRVLPPTGVRSTHLSSSSSSGPHSTSSSSSAVAPLPLAPSTTTTTTTDTRHSPATTTLHSSAMANRSGSEQPQSKPVRVSSSPSLPPTQKTPPSLHPLHSKQVAHKETRAHPDSHSNSSSSRVSPADATVETATTTSSSPSSSSPPPRAVPISDGQKNNNKKTKQTTTGVGQQVMENEPMSKMGEEVSRRSEMSARTASGLGYLACLVGSAGADKEKEKESGYISYRRMSDSDGSPISPLPFKQASGPAWSVSSSQHLIPPSSPPQAPPASSSSALQQAHHAHTHNNNVRLFSPTSSKTVDGISSILPGAASVSNRDAISLLGGLHSSYVPSSYQPTPRRLNDEEEEDEDGEVESETPAAAVDHPRRLGAAAGAEAGTMPSSGMALLFDEGGGAHGAASQRALKTPPRRTSPGDTLREPREAGVGGLLFGAALNGANSSEGRKAGSGKRKGQTDKNRKDNNKEEDPPSLLGTQGTSFAVPPAFSSQGQSGKGAVNTLDEGSRRHEHRPNTTTSTSTTAAAGTLERQGKVPKRRETGRLLFGRREEEEDDDDDDKYGDKKDISAGRNGHGHGAPLSSSLFPSGTHTPTANAIRHADPPPMIETVGNERKGWAGGDEMNDILALIRRQGIRPARTPEIDDARLRPPLEHRHSRLGRWTPDPLDLPLSRTAVADALLSSRPPPGAPYPSSSPSSFRDPLALWGDHLGGTRALYSRFGASTRTAYPGWRRRGIDSGTAATPTRAVANTLEAERAAAFDAASRRTRELLGEYRQSSFTPSSGGAAVKDLFTGGLATSRERQTCASLSLPPPLPPSPAGWSSSTRPTLGALAEGPSLYARYDRTGLGGGGVDRRSHFQPLLGPVDPPGVSNERRQLYQSCLTHQSKASQDLDRQRAFFIQMLKGEKGDTTVSGLPSTSMAARESPPANKENPPASSTPSPLAVVGSSRTASPETVLDPTADNSSVMRNLSSTAFFLDPESLKVWQQPPSTLVSPSNTANTTNTPKHPPPPLPQHKKKRSPPFTSPSVMPTQGSGRSLSSTLRSRTSPPGGANGTPPNTRSSGVEPCLVPVLTPAHHTYSSPSHYSHNNQNQSSSGSGGLVGPLSQEEAERMAELLSTVRALRRETGSMTSQLANVFDMWREEVDDHAYGSGSRRSSCSCSCSCSARSLSLSSEAAGGGGEVDRRRRARCRQGHNSGGSAKRRYRVQSNEEEEDRHQDHKPKRVPTAHELFGDLFLPLSPARREWQEQQQQQQQQQQRKRLKSKESHSVHNRPRLRSTSAVVDTPEQLAADTAWLLPEEDHEEGRRVRIGSTATKKSKEEDEQVDKSRNARSGLGQPVPPYDPLIEHGLPDAPPLSIQLELQEFRNGLKRQEELQRLYLEQLKATQAGRTTDPQGGGAGVSVSSSSSGGPSKLRETEKSNTRRSRSPTPGLDRTNTPLVVNATSNEGADQQPTDSSASALPPLLTTVTLPPEVTERLNEMSESVHRTARLTQKLREESRHREERTKRRLSHMERRAARRLEKAGEGGTTNMSPHSGLETTMTMMGAEPQQEEKVDDPSSHHHHDHYRHQQLPPHHPSHADTRAHSQTHAPPPSHAPPPPHTGGSGPMAMGCPWAHSCGCSMCPPPPPPGAPAAVFSKGACIPYPPSSSCCNSYAYPCGAACVPSPHYCYPVTCAAAPPCTGSMARYPCVWHGGPMPLHPCDGTANTRRTTTTTTTTTTTVSPGGESVSHRCVDLDGSAEAERPNGLQPTFETPCGKPSATTTQECSDTPGRGARVDGCTSPLRFITLVDTTLVRGRGGSSESHHRHSDDEEDEEEEDNEEEDVNCRSNSRKSDRGRSRDSDRHFKSRDTPSCGGEMRATTKDKGSHGTRLSTSGREEEDDGVCGMAMTTSDSMASKGRQDASSRSRSASASASAEPFSLSRGRNNGERNLGLPPAGVRLPHGDSRSSGSREATTSEVTRDSQRPAVSSPAPHLRKAAEGGEPSVAGDALNVVTMKAEKNDKAEEEEDDDEEEEEEVLRNMADMFVEWLVAMQSGAVERTRRERRASRRRRREKLESHDTRQQKARKRGEKWLASETTAERQRRRHRERREKAERTSVRHKRNKIRSEGVEERETGGSSRHRHRHRHRPCVDHREEDDHGHHGHRRRRGRRPSDPLLPRQVDAEKGRERETEADAAESSRAQRRQERQEGRNCAGEQEAAAIHVQKRIAQQEGDQQSDTAGEKRGRLLAEERATEVQKEGEEVRKTPKRAFQMGTSSVGEAKTTNTTTTTSMTPGSAPTGVSANAPALPAPHLVTLRAPVDTTPSDNYPHDHNHNHNNNSNNSNRNSIAVEAAGPSGSTLLSGEEESSLFGAPPEPLEATQLPIDLSNGPHGQAPSGQTAPGHGQGETSQPTSQGETDLHLLPLPGENRALVKDGSDRNPGPAAGAADTMGAVEKGVKPLTTTHHGASAVASRYAAALPFMPSTSRHHHHHHHGSGTSPSHTSSGTSSRSHSSSHSSTHGVVVVVPEIAKDFQALVEDGGEVSLAEAASSPQQQKQKRPSVPWGGALPFLSPQPTPVAMASPAPHAALVPRATEDGKTMKREEKGGEGEGEMEGREERKPSSVSSSAVAAVGVPPHGNGSGPLLNAGALLVVPPPPPPPSPLTTTTTASPPIVIPPLSLPPSPTAVVPSPTTTSPRSPSLSPALSSGPGAPIALLLPSAVEAVAAPPTVSGEGVHSSQSEYTYAYSSFSYSTTTSSVSSSSSSASGDSAKKRRRAEAKEKSNEKRREAAREEKRAAHRRRVKRPKPSKNSGAAPPDEVYSTADAARGSTVVLEAANASKSPAATGGPAMPAVLPVEGDEDLSGMPSPSPITTSDECRDSSGDPQQQQEQQEEKKKKSVAGGASVVEDREKNKEGSAENRTATKKTSLPRLHSEEHQPPKKKTKSSSEKNGTRATVRETAEEKKKRERAEAEQKVRDKKYQAEMKAWKKKFGKLHAKGFPTPPPPIPPAVATPRGAASSQTDQGVSTTSAATAPSVTAVRMAAINAAAPTGDTSGARTPPRQTGSRLDPSASESPAEGPTAASSTTNGPARGARPIVGRGQTQPPPPNLWKRVTRRLTCKSAEDGGTTANTTPGATTTRRFPSPKLTLPSPGSSRGASPARSVSPTMEHAAPPGGARSRMNVSGSPGSPSGVSPRSFSGSSTLNMVRPSSPASLTTHQQQQLQQQLQQLRSPPRSGVSRSGVPSPSTHTSPSSATTPRSAGGRMSSPQRSVTLARETAAAPVTTFPSPDSSLIKTPARPFVSRNT